MTNRRESDNSPEQYKNSKKRLVLLLAQCLGIVYTIVRGNEEAQILAALLIPMMIMSLKTWRNE